MYKIKLFLVCFLSLFTLSLSFAQNRTITGKVTSFPGQNSIVGATVSIKGSTQGATTSIEGTFSLSVPSGAVTLVVSSIGFQNNEVTVAGDAISVSIELSESSQELGEVVVTAFGIERPAKSLTYATQVVKGEELTRVKDANPMNNLIGKVSGLQINRSSSGIGGSVNIVLRGLKSNRNNQPLYVVDGLPITNTAGSGSEGAFGGSTDRGDILSTLNADDIESISVLKGASASALYGSEGANGAIMITTKKGVAGSTRIDFSSSSTFDQAYYLPKMQYTYAQSPTPKNDSEESWGPKGNFDNNVDGFFQMGTTFINSIGLSGGTEKTRNYFSYANTTNKGILPTNKFNQHTVSFRNSSKFFKDKLSFDGNLMYAAQDIHNRPSSGLYFGVLSGLYMFPRGQDFEAYKNEYQYLSPSRNLYLQNWFNINADKGLGGTHHQQNPYWVLNNNPTDQSRNNIIGAISLKYALSDWLSLSARGTLNRQWNTFERRVNAGTQGVISGSTSTALPVDNGRYSREESTGLTKYGDVLLIGNKDIGNDFQLNFTAGSSIKDINNSGWSVDARKLFVANGFTLNNLFRNEANSINDLGESFNRMQIQSVFGSANIGFKEYLYLDLTARNDWSSTLANTPSEKSGYFYYSGGITTVLSDILKFPEWNNYSKLRFSYAQVGNGVGVYASIIPDATIGNSGNTVPNTSGVFNGEALKPEISNSIELGYEGRFINNRLNVDVALYKTNTKNQFFSFQGPPASLTPTLFLNAGDVENKGIEVSVNYDVIKKTKLRWRSGLNYTANKNKVLALHPKLSNTYPIGNFNVLRVGGSFGDLWGRTFMRDPNGVMVVSNDSIPMAGPDGYIGSSNPKAIVGWNNSVNFGNFSASLTVDGRFGGKVISTTEGYLNSFGVGKESADARDAGGVKVNAVKQDGTPVNLVPARNYYLAVGNRDGIIEGQTYSATNIRLRELSFGYSFPLKSNVVKQASLNLIGRNLFFLKNNAPYDSELNTNTGAIGQGYDSFGLPTTRSYGLNLKLSF
ncbi:MAG: SusC/RagA family TonB-linked outer membrane protein [Sphingobacteriaceae bacterium]